MSPYYICMLHESIVLLTNASNTYIYTVGDIISLSVVLLPSKRLHPPHAHYIALQQSHHSDDVSSLYNVARVDRADNALFAG